jgi:DNA polymerase
MIHLDFETRSEADLKTCGVHVYARHPSTRVICASWAVDDGEPRLWFDPRFGLEGGDIDDLFALAWQGETIAAFNAEFERLIWNHVLLRQLVSYQAGRIRALRIEQTYCVAIAAYAMTYGRTMADVAAQCGAAELKDTRGKTLVQRHCKPSGVDLIGGPKWNDDREGILELGEYCRQDVRTERAILHRLEPLSKYELDLYHVDQRINDRGFPVDLDFCRAAIEIASTTQAGAGERLAELTGGTITAPSQRARILERCRALGYTSNTLGKDAIAQWLAGETAKSAKPELLELLKLRLAGGKSAHAKFEAAIERSCADGRIRGSLLMNGARTLRWTGAGVQPQNMKRGLSDPVEQGHVIEVAKSHGRELLELLYGDPLEVLGDAARGLVCAEPGHELIVSDFSAIEARVLASIAGDEPNLTAFLENRCIYRQMGAVIAGKSYDEIAKDSEERYIGKQAELAFGYGMGEKTFKERQKTYGRDFPLSFCRDVKDKYRSLHKAIVKFWRQIEVDAIRCISRGEPVKRRWYSFEMRPQGLVMIGPSGAQQWYIGARIKMVDRWSNGEMQPSVQYQGLADYQWTTLETYGGKLTENLVQFVSRCIQADAVKAAEKAGFRVVIHTHDEIVAHNTIGAKSVDELERIMGSASSSWALGWPLKASGGWKGERYRK